MKRALYRRLIATARQCRPDRPHEITATFTWQPTSMPFWSPGPDWVELKSACLWARQSTTEPGLDAIVLTSTLNDAGTNHRNTEALLSAFLPADGIGIASVSDKHHKIHTYAAEGSVKTLVEFAKPGEPTHPAEWYWRYMQGTRERFKRAVRSAPNPYGWDLWYLGIERTPHGAMLLSFEVELSKYRESPDPETGLRHFWWDAARYPGLVASVAAEFGSRVRLAAGGHSRAVGDPLWQAGIALLYPDRRRHKRRRLTVQVENTYACGLTSGGEYQVPVPPVGADEAEMDDWWQDEVVPLTGDGHACGATERALYEATITAAPGRPALVGRTWSAEG